MTGTRLEVRSSLDDASHFPRTEYHRVETPGGGWRVEETLVVPVIVDLAPGLGEDWFREMVQRDPRVQREAYQEGQWSAVTDVFYEDLRVKLRG